jgi:hypothetical protein
MAGIDFVSKDFYPRVGFSGIGRLGVPAVERILGVYPLLQVLTLPAARRPSRMGNRWG